MKTDPDTAQALYIGLDVHKEQTVIALQAKSDLLGSIPVPGETTVQIVLGELSDLAEFSDARRPAAWVGLIHRICGIPKSGQPCNPEKRGCAGM